MKTRNLAAICALLGLASACSKESTLPAATPAALTDQAFPGIAGKYVARNETLVLRPDGQFDLRFTRDVDLHGYQPRADRSLEETDTTFARCMIELEGVARLLGDSSRALRQIVLTVDRSRVVGAEGSRSGRDGGYEVCRRHAEEIATTRTWLIEVREADALHLSLALEFRIPLRNDRMGRPVESRDHQVAGLAAIFVRQGESLDLTGRLMPALTGMYRSEGSRESALRVDGANRQLLLTDHLCGIQTQISVSQIRLGQGQLRLGIASATTRVDSTPDSEAFVRERSRHQSECRRLADSLAGSRSPERAIRFEWDEANRNLKLRVPGVGRLARLTFVPLTF